MSFAPAIITAASGSIGEVGFCILLVVAAWRGKSYFAVVFTGLWLMLGLMSAGAYIADAKAQLIPLISMGETAKHDWNFVLSQIGWLNACTQIGGAISLAGMVVGVLSLSFGLYLIYKKIRIRHKAKSNLPT